MSYKLTSVDGTKSIGAKAIGDAAVDARWRMGDGRVLAIAANLGEAACPFEPPGKPLFVTGETALGDGRLAGRSTAAFLA